ECLLEREPARSPELVAVVPERSRDLRRLRQEECLHVERADQDLPQRDHADEHDDRRQPVDESAPHTGVRSRSWPRWRASRTAVTSSKKCGSSRVVAVRGCGRSIGITFEIRPGRGDNTTTRVARQTNSEHDVETDTT